MAQREQLLSEFVRCAAGHVTGDGKGEARVFVDRLFRAFGRKGSTDVGGTPEFRVHTAAYGGGGAP